MTQQHDSTPAAPRTTSGDIDPVRFADWITDTAVARLSALRGEIRDAVPPGLDVAVDADVEDLSARLLRIVEALVALAGELRARPTAGAAPRRVEALVGDVTAECERARALIARSTEVLRAGVEVRRSARD